MTAQLDLFSVVQQLIKDVHLVLLAVLRDNEYFPEFLCIGIASIDYISHHWHITYMTVALRKYSSLALSI